MKKRLIQYAVTAVLAIIALVSVQGANPKNQGN